MGEKRTDVGLQEEKRTGQRESPLRLGNPSRLFDRFTDEIEHLLDEFGLRTSWLVRHGRPWSTFNWQRASAAGAAWVPDIEMIQRNDELIVRVDLPGLRKEDITVDVTNDALAIHGERRQEAAEEHGGIYRSERSYGSFSRVIPLPDGAITDHSKATFKDGVLEITMPAPPEQAMRGRRLEITETAQTRR